MMASSVRTLTEVWSLPTLDDPGTSASPLATILGRGRGPVNVNRLRRGIRHYRRFTSALEVAFRYHLNTSFSSSVTLAAGS